MTVDRDEIVCDRKLFTEAERAELDELTSDFAGLTESMSWVDSDIPALGSQLMPGDGADLLAGKSRVYLSPNGLLHQLPLHGLTWQDAALIESFAVSYVPNFVALSRRASSARGPAIVIGIGTFAHAPPLPSAQAEAAAVAARYPGSHLLLGPAASRAAFDTMMIDGRLAAAGLIHLATHGQDGPIDDPLTARFLLADGEVVGMKAFSTMAPVSQPLVRADESLDLYTTTTSVNGYDTAIPTGIGTVSHTDRAYRQLMHFHHEAVASNAGGQGTNHLGAQHVPALAFAARATSSFPGAFPPVGLGTFDKAVGGGVNTKAIADRFVYGLEYGATQQTQWYMDGGVLDNGPFDHAINAIAAKRAESETARELIYVEPDPGHGPTPQSPTDPPEQPTVQSTVWAARMTIPQRPGLRG